jgi:hypothetical protein
MGFGLHKKKIKKYLRTLTENSIYETTIFIFFNYKNIKSW